ncbi:hypothetical protein HHI36_011374 [Cryptolaemus montrouzieri]
MADNNQKNDVVLAPTCMESVNRIVKLPVVESSIQTATNVYGKVKDMNEYAKWGFETMENTLHTVLETGKPYAIPVVQKLDGPIKKVDSVLCSGLDYVESKVPAVKLPPGEIISQLYTSTREYVHDNVTPKVDSAYKSVQGMVDPAVQTAKNVVNPAVQAAKKVTDPAVNLAKPTVEAAYKIVEPMVQPAVDRANALKDYSVQKVEEFLHRETRTEEGTENSDCEDCRKDTQSH